MTDWAFPEVARMAFHGIKLVRYEKHEQAGRTQHAVTLPQYRDVVHSVLEDFDHGHDIETPRLERKALADSLDSRDVHAELAKA